MAIEKFILARKTSPIVFKIAIPIDSILIPRKYLVNRELIEADALLIFCSYLSGTTATIILVNVPSSKRKKNEIKTMEKSATPKLAMIVVTDDMKSDNALILKESLTLESAYISILKDSSSEGNTFLIKSFNSESGADICFPIVLMSIRLNS